jgi:hypothetical protein
MAAMRPPRHIPFWTIVGPSLLLVIALAGCGDARAPLYAVRGRVVDGQGQPATGAQLFFNPVGGDTKGVPRPVGHVDEKGEFRLTTYVEGDGAPEGDYAVTIIWPPVRTSPFDPPGGDRLNNTYADAANPKVRFKVEARDDNEVPTIQLP